jgi:hypothetical protein
MNPYAALPEPNRNAVLMRRRLLFLAAGLIGLAVSFCAGALLGGLLGALAGETGAKQRRFAYEVNAIASILSSDPAFAQIEILMYTGDGSAYLMGEVATKSDYERLRSAMTHLLGSAREVAPLGAVSTKEDSPNSVL